MTIWVFTTVSGAKYEVPGDAPTFEDACVNAAAVLGISVAAFNAVYVPVIDMQSSFGSHVDDV